MFDKKMFLATLLLKNISVDDFAKIINVTTPTLYRKMSGESDFYRREIQSSRKVFSKEEADKIFFAEEVA